MSHDINTIIDMYEYGKINEVMDAFRADPSLLKCRDMYGDTILDRAASNGDKDIVAILLSLGASADTDDPKYCSPLIRAVQSQSPNTIEIEELLIGHGANVNTRVLAYSSALHAAIVIDSIEIVEFLLKKGADINICGEDDETPLWCAAIKGSEKMVRFLLEHGANPWLREAILGTPLDVARGYDTEGHRNIVKLLEERMAEGKKGG